MRNAGRFLQEAGMDAVKLEGGRALADTGARHRPRRHPGDGARGPHAAEHPRAGRLPGAGPHGGGRRELLEDALALEDAGCFAIVLESVPDRLAAYVTERLRIPTIGIGAGPGTSGQVLVTHDLLGLFDGFTPKFVKRYADLGDGHARRRSPPIASDVETHAFPAREHSYAMSDEEWQAFLAALPPASRRGRRKVALALIARRLRHPGARRAGSGQARSSRAPAAQAAVTLTGTWREASIDRA